ncbi:MAG: hypothetical protein QXF77_06320 [Candidatus Jordarchaeales archaeon]
MRKTVTLLLSLLLLLAPIALTATLTPTPTTPIIPAQPQQAPKETISEGVTFYLHPSYNETGIHANTQSNTSYLGIDCTGIQNLMQAVVRVEREPFEANIEVQLNVANKTYCDNTINTIISQLNVTLQGIGITLTETSRSIDSMGTFGICTLELHGDSYNLSRLVPENTFARKIVENYNDAEIEITDTHTPGSVVGLCDVLVDVSGVIMRTDTHNYNFSVRKALGITEQQITVNVTPTIITIYYPGNLTDYTNTTILQPGIEQQSISWMIINAGVTFDDIFVAFTYVPSYMEGYMEWNLTAGEHHLRFDAGLMNITINVSSPVRLSVRSMLENPGGGLPSGLGFLGRFIEITLDNESALVSLTLVFSYSDDEVARAGLDESTLAVYYWDEQSRSWVRIEGSVVDTVANTVTVTVDHITYFAIIGSTGKEEASWLPFVVFLAQPPNTALIIVGVGAVVLVSMVVALILRRRRA